MPRTQKESQARELEEAERDVLGGPHVFESDVEDEDRSRVVSIWTDRRASFEDDDADEPEVEDLDLEDLYAMEGPDAA